MKEMMKKIVDAFVPNASKYDQIPSDAIGTIASTGALALALTFGLAGAAEAACSFDGPVANDNVYSTVLLYMRGFMSREATIAELRVHKLYDQIVFATPAAFRRLTFVRSEAL